MTALVALLVAVAVLVGLGFAFGSPALAVLGGLAVLLVVGYFLVMAFSRRTPSELTREAHEQEFLGPGGPDDPSR